jgi:hypothetical protein
MGTTLILKQPLRRCFLLLLFLFMVGWITIVWRIKFIPIDGTDNVSSFWKATTSSKSVLDSPFQYLHDNIIDHDHNISNNSLYVTTFILTSFLEQKEEYTTTLPMTSSSSNHVVHLPPTTSAYTFNASTMSTSSSSPPSPLRNILFVHVGKAGGETIKSVLHIGCASRRNRLRRQRCYQELSFQLHHVPPSILSQQVTSYLHCNTIFPSPKHLQRKKNNQTIHITSYLFNLRHPVDRIVSWYYYIHPRFCRQNSSMFENNTNTNNTVNGISSSSSLSSSSSSSSFSSTNCLTQLAIKNDPIHSWEAQFFVQCFPTIHDWVQALRMNHHHHHHHDNNDDTNSSSSSSSHNVTHVCIQLAWATILGQVSIRQSSLVAHATFNLQYYVSKTILSLQQHPQEQNNHQQQQQQHQQPREILVIRTSDLWNDLVGLEYYVRQHSLYTSNDDNDNIVHDRSSMTISSQNSNLSRISPFGLRHGMNETHGSQYYYHTQNYTQEPSSGTLQLSNHEIRILCCALQSELYWFFQLLMNATNLPPETREGSWQQALQHCFVSYRTWNDLLLDCRYVLNKKYTS